MCSDFFGSELSSPWKRRVFKTHHGWKIRELSQQVDQIRQAVTGGFADDGAAIKA
jgi:hypothetical protein